jgi:hypothetical protein
LLLIESNIILPAYNSSIIPQKTFFHVTNVSGKSLVVLNFSEIIREKCSFNDDLEKCFVGSREENEKKITHSSGDQKESKSKQALQIISHVVAEFYANKRLMHGRRQFVVSNAIL